MKPQKIKKVWQNRIDAEIKDLNKVVDMVVESQDLLDQLESKSIGEFELKINEKSGFVNAMMSATAYGKEAEYKRLLELETLIGDRLSADDLTSNKTLKKRVLDVIRYKHVEYYTEEEIKLKNLFDKMINTYNSLDSKHRIHIGFTRDGKLAFNPFSTLL
jgi:hypothetical protein